MTAGSDSCFVTPHSVPHTCMNNPSFAAVLIDDISDSPYIACAGHVEADPSHIPLADNADFFQDDCPIPIAHSTMLGDVMAEDPCSNLEMSSNDAAADTADPLIAHIDPAQPITRPEAPGARGLKVGPYEFAYVVKEMWPHVNAHAQDSEHLKIYDIVRSTGLPNYLSARIQIPSYINCDAWDHLLEGYADAEIANFLRYGWPSGYTAPTPPIPSDTNHPSALCFPADVTKFLDKEVKLGAMLGPFTAPPFREWSQVSPLMTVEKKDSASRRVIIDLSFPMGYGVNSGIPKNFFQGAERQYSLPTIHHLGQRIIAMGRDCYIWKADLERAYRQLRCDPLDYQLMGVMHRWAYFTDICPSFGCRGSSMSQQRVSEAVCYLMDREGYSLLAYVDDFCSIGRSAAAAHNAYKAFLSLMDVLGLQLAPEKCAPPSKQMEWLGFWFDTVEMTITIPPAKLKEILEIATAWGEKTRASRRDLQRLAGKLNHVSQCVLPARKFMSRILAALRASPMAGSMPVGDDLRRDVAWFAQYAARCNGRLLLVEKLPTFEIQCDACLEGGGGFSATEFYSIRFPTHMAEQHHISRIEAMNIVLAVKTLVPAEMRATEIIITTDNSAAMYSLNTGRTRDPILAACSRELWLLAALQELKITVNHAPGVTLVLADALSRRHQSQDQEDVVIQMTRHLGLTQTIPCDIDCILTPEL